jgi:hypothetical protein
MDDPARGWAVDLVCAETLASGVNSTRGDGSIDQRAASTVQWTARHKTNLLQPDLLDNPLWMAPALQVRFADLACWSGAVFCPAC